MENGQCGVSINHVLRHAEEVFKREKENAVIQKHNMVEKLVLALIIQPEFAIQILVQLTGVGRNGVCGESAPFLVEEVERTDCEDVLIQTQNMEESVVLEHQFSRNNAVQHHVQSMVDGVHTQLIQAVV